ncbi:MAG: tetratricopeptide repeat protein [Longimicrobiales bacterium]
MKLDAFLRNRKRVVLAVAIVAGLVYANAVPNRFAYDDYHIIANNSAIQSIQTLPSAIFAPYWPGVYGRENGLWRPTTQALFGVQWIVSGGAPWLFHLMNVLAHVAVTSLVLLLLGELMSMRAAFFGALVFAIHPVHVEAVANLVGLSELVSAGLFLMACLVHVRGPPESRWRDAVLIGLLYAVAFGAKEGAATLPAIIFLLDASRGSLTFADLPRYVRERWRVYAALIIGAALLLIPRLGILGTIANPLGPLGADLLFEVPRIWTISEVWGNYVRLWVLPLDLSSDYAPGVIPISIGWKLANSVGAALALALLGAALIAWRRGPMRSGLNSPRAAGFGVVWFMLTLSPVANVFFVAGVLLAERTLYLPSVGLAAATGWLFARFYIARSKVALVTVGLVVLLGAARTWERNPTWKDNPAMLNALVADFPHSGRSQWVLGDAFMDRGLTKQALQSYRIAVDLLDAHYQVTTDVAQTLIRQEMYEGAEGLLRHAWRGEPGFAVAPALLAEIYSEWNQPELAERFSRLALTIDDRDPLRPHIISWSLAARGRFAEAASARESALQSQGMGNYWQQWLTMAYLGLAEGDSVSARTALDAALAAELSGLARAHVDSVKVAVLGGAVVDSLVVN